MMIDRRPLKALAPAILLTVVGGAAGWIAGWMVVFLLAAYLLAAWLMGRDDQTAAAPGGAPPSPVDAQSVHRTLDALPSPILLLDGRRRVVAANRAARKLFDGPLEDRDLALTVRHPEALEAANRVLRGIEARASGAVMTLSGRTRGHYQVEVVALPPDSPWSAKAVLGLHDVSALIEAEGIHADFVANVSHELRSPLSTLVGFIETLQTSARDDPPARERFLAIMADEAGRMNRLINDLLSLSRVEAVEYLRPADPVDLVSLIGKVRQALADRAADRGMTLALAVDGALPTIPGDADQLTEVVHNLIDNAIKYGREGSPVEIAAAIVADAPGTSAPHVRLSVANQGEGIAKEHIPRLTERFYRVDKGRSRAMGGTGLGLAIVKHIVNRHRGRLTIVSTPGEGSEFSVLLPIDPPPGSGEGAGA